VFDRYKKKNDLMMHSGHNINWV